MCLTNARTRSVISGILFISFGTLAIHTHETTFRQSVYLCLSCGEDRGFCSACSISCHTDHEQVELYAACLWGSRFIYSSLQTRFPKRKFRCDCTTLLSASSPAKCTLHKATFGEEIGPNLDNHYNQNFRGGGLFCRCHTNYKGEEENEVMAQCLICEVRFHIGVKRL